MNAGTRARPRPSKLRDGAAAVERAKEQDRQEVARTVRAGLTDRQGARALHMDAAKFKRLRQELGLEPNQKGGDHG